MHPIVWYNYNRSISSRVYPVYWILFPEFFYKNIFLFVLMFNDQRSNIITSLFVVSAMRTITIGPLKYEPIMKCLPFFSSIYFLTFFVFQHRQNAALSAMSSTSTVSTTLASSSLWIKLQRPDGLDRAWGQNAR